MFKSFLNFSDVLPIYVPHFALDGTFIKCDFLLETIKLIYFHFED